MKKIVVMLTITFNIFIMVSCPNSLETGNGADPDNQNDSTISEFVTAAYHHGSQENQNLKITYHINQHQEADYGTAYFYLQWPPFPGAQSYKVYHADETGKAYELLPGGLTGTIHYDTFLIYANETDVRYYWVVAVTDKGRTKRPDTIIKVTYDLKINAGGPFMPSNADYTLTVEQSAIIIPAINGIAVTPNSISVYKGATQRFNAEVNAFFEADTTVSWSVNSNLSSIDDTGLLRIGLNETAQTLAVAATSVFNNTIKGAAVVNVEDLGFDPRDVIGTIFVTSGAPSGSGSLAEALSIAKSGDIISIHLSGDKTINASSDYRFNQDYSITIEGNGANITGSAGKLLTIGSIGTGATVKIRRLHFRDNIHAVGLDLNGYGGSAIVESCIFSNLRRGIFTGVDTTIIGCTFFYNNDGAVYRAPDKILQPTGNIFYGNTSENNYNVIGSGDGGSVISLGYNISDYASGNDPNTGSGYNFTTGDITYTGITAPVDTMFRPIDESIIIVPQTLSIYPSKDFNGHDRVYTGGKTSAGAVSN
ncbi:MAG: Ig-like domain-containing protein [Treponema sp.]|nr:Ig-like domain-containing protein [Treponema sp.]